MELIYSRKEKIAGVFVIFTALLLLSTLVIIGRGKDWFKKYVSYYTTFNESYNLQENADVKLLETKIGKVKNISLLGDRVKIELSILENYASRIRSGSVVTVESPTFIGSEYVSIKPGRKDLPLIPEGGAIPSKPKRSVSDLLDEFQVEKTAKMFVTAVQNLSELVQHIRDPDGPLMRILDDLNKTTTHIEAITRDIQAGKGTAGALLKSTSLLDTVHENLVKAGGILDQISAATAKMPGEMGQVGTILDNVKRASTKAPETMDMVQDNLSTTKAAAEGVVEGIAQIKVILKGVEESLVSFKIILDNMKKASFDVPALSRSSVEGIKDARESIESINKVVQSLQKNFLIRSNLPPDPVGKNTDAQLRQ